MRDRETRNNLIYNLILLQIRHNLTDIKIETTAVNVIKLSSESLVKRKNRLECLSLPSRCGSGLHLSGSGRARVETLGLGLLRAWVN
jgi:hypothetical protein